ncbi:hypothetical protein N7509_004494 [Penicillium cosmopolitanum]|uniref:Uncharacterized protein n=1 Tax=Penicillium cosmopolitanum TaxID=1131564 RepID=A0A9X0BCH0_9EURO|nr:uncharacterized protein N7509_004494 [Penicillium cosmopolitanum]KAJ5404623.1 hypothetical protein N7509_004494 [Penicillium cosmopolitanum]
MAIDLIRYINSYKLPSIMTLYPSAFMLIRHRKLFLALKQHFKKQNNLYTFWSGKVTKKSEFLCVISEVQATV